MEHRVTAGEQRPETRPELRPTVQRQGTVREPMERVVGVEHSGALRRVLRELDGTLDRLGT